MSLSFTAIRYAEPSDLPLLQGVEASAGRQFDALMATSGWAQPPTGSQRAAEPGVLLVAGDPAIGFAHLLELDGRLHLEELSVNPSFGRRGIGTALLRAACGVALDRGQDSLTLMTFADVPWNGPFYAARGFAPVPEPLPPMLARLAETERRLGLDQLGRRIAMVAPLADLPVPMPAVSVIPLRDGPAGLEAFVQHRVSTMDFAAGAVVFPGGRIDAADREAGRVPSLEPGLVAGHIERWAQTSFGGLGADPASAARTLLATGVRELHEETGALVSPERLIPWDNWVTPIGVPRRFDVYFYVLPLPATDAAQPAHTTTEATNSQWLPIAEVATGAETGRLVLLPPTRTIVAELAELGSLDAVLALRPRITAVRHDISGRRPRPSTSGG